MYGLTATPQHTFLSTPSARRATSFGEQLGDDVVISIHALREEGDHPGYNIGELLGNFYPRPPRGGRPRPSAMLSPSYDFYPRPPRGGRPAQLARASAAEAISIHALREEGDSAACHRAAASHISIHALREEGDPLLRQR